MFDLRAIRDDPAVIIGSPPIIEVLAAKAAEIKFVSVFDHGLGRFE